MSVTRGKRSPFPCGHRGYGEICHRCKSADELLKKAAKPQEPKAEALKLEAARLKTVSQHVGKIAPSDLLSSIKEAI